MRSGHACRHRIRLTFETRVLRADAKGRRQRRLLQRRRGKVLLSDRLDRLFDLCEGRVRRRALRIRVRDLDAEALTVVLRESARAPSLSCITTLPLVSNFSTSPSRSRSSGAARTGCEFSHTVSAPVGQQGDL